MFKKFVGNAPAAALLILGAAIIFAAATAGSATGAADENEQAPASGAYVAPLPESTDPAGVPRLENCIVYDEARIKLITLDGEYSRDLNEKVYDYIYVISPVLSPDGTKVAFQVTVDCHWDICISNLDGSAEKNITNFFAEDMWPAFSPDGTKIVFASDRNAEDGSSNTDIYIMNVDGSAVTRLTENDGAWPAFSPDGSKIAFVSGRDGNWGIYVMNADGSGQTRLTNNNASAQHPAFSPDGSKIAFDLDSELDGNTEIYVMNADGSAQTRLTRNPAWDTDPVFSPDGRKIAYDPEVSKGMQEIYVINADGTDDTWVSPGGGVWYQHPSFSPMRVDGVLLDTYGRVIEE
jgi:Tol biopolymer transport system component